MGGRSTGREATPSSASESGSYSESDANEAERAWSLRALASERWGDGGVAASAVAREREREREEPMWSGF